MKNITDIKPPKNRTCFVCGKYLPKGMWVVGTNKGIACHDHTEMLAMQNQLDSQMEALKSRLERFK